MSSNLNLAAQIEALLFVATEPLSARQLSTLTNSSEGTVNEALNELEFTLATRGIRLSRLGNKYQLVSAPEASEVLKKQAADTSRPELSAAALETLAIIAYRGPITGHDISDLRGVISDTMIRNLTSRGLIESAGRSPQPGRPPLYQVSFAFLEQFGLVSAADLPPIETNRQETSHAH